MTTLTTSKFNPAAKEIFETAAQFGEIFTIATDKGSAVIMSEEEYRGLIATLQLYSDPKVVEEILQAKAEPIEECIPDDEVEW